MRTSNLPGIVLAALVAGCIFVGTTLFVDALLPLLQMGIDRPQRFGWIIGLVPGTLMFFIALRLIREREQKLKDRKR